MKKLIFLLVLAIAASAMLFLMAFYYIDFSVHWSATYEALLNGKYIGIVKVDRYVTEDKIIYKSRSETPYALSYPTMNERLFLKKKTIIPVKYVAESGIGRKTSRFISLIQKEEKTDYLYLEHPRFLVMRDFETGEKTMLFLPYDIMTYMPLMEKYNYWKKGTQYFEVITPLEDAMPPMRDKIGVRELGDEYISIMGRKVEAEAFAVKGKGLPETKITLSKYGHHILCLDIKSTGARYIMTAYAKDPARRIGDMAALALRNLKEKLVFRAEDSNKASTEDIFTESEKEEPLAAGAPAAALPERHKDVFIESGGLILSGRIWSPEGNGPFPAVLFITKDGPMTGGEAMLVRAYGEQLSAAGYVLMAFDGLGQGKSQGSAMDTDDDNRIKNIMAALSYLCNSQLVDKNAITLIGHKGGAYLAVEAARMSECVSSCITLGMPLDPDRPENPIKTLKGKIQGQLEKEGLGSFDGTYMDMVASKLDKHLEGVMMSTEGTAYFMGTKLPVNAYRKYLGRKPFKSILALDKPLLLVFGKNDRSADPAALDALRKAIFGIKTPIKIATFNYIDDYMGKLDEQGNGWGFAPDFNVLALIKEWLAQNIPSKTPK